MTNATYLDCPVGKFENKDNFTMSIAIHNPSSNDLKSAKIAVPKGNYEAKVFDKKTQEFKMVEVSVLCHLDYNLTLHKIDSCFAHVPVSTRAREVSFLLLERKDML